MVRGEKSSYYARKNNLNKYIFIITDKGPFRKYAGIELSFVKLKKHTIIEKIKFENMRGIVLFNKFFIRK